MNTAKPTPAPPPDGLAGLSLQQLFELEQIHSDFYYRQLHRLMARGVRALDAAPQASAFARRHAPAARTRLLKQFTAQRATGQSSREVAA